MRYDWVFLGLIPSSHATDSVSPPFTLPFTLPLFPPALAFVKLGLHTVYLGTGGSFLSRDKYI